MGSPDIALLIAVLVALVTLGGHIQTGQHHGRELLRKLTAESFEPIAQVLMILAAAGGLSGILRDSGAAQATVGDCARRAHAAAGAGLAAGRGDPRLHGLGDGSHGRSLGGAGAHGRPRRRAPRVAGAGHRHRLAHPLPSERSRLLADPVLLQAGGEGDPRHLVGAGDGAVGSRPGNDAAAGGGAAVKNRQLPRRRLSAEIEIQAPSTSPATARPIAY